jgi:hypothetical protein
MAFGNVAVDPLTITRCDNCAPETGAAGRIELTSCENREQH